MKLYMIIALLFLMTGCLTDKTSIVRAQYDEIHIDRNLVSQYNADVQIAFEQIYWNERNTNRFVHFIPASQATKDSLFKTIKGIVYAAQGYHQVVDERNRYYLGIIAAQDSLIRKYLQ